MNYGYRVGKTINGGMVTTGEREIVPEEARVVERIFREFVAGVSPKQVAKNLNRERVVGIEGESRGDAECRHKREEVARNGRPLAAS
jgi:site-specific DNA recombinase